MLISLFTIGCKNQSEKKEIAENQLAANPQKVALSISGMTCEIGCAKFIQSNLSKKEGVLQANVVFKDSIANITFDANKTSKADLISLVDKLADGKLYNASETKLLAHSCDKNCAENCELATNQKP